MKLSLSILASFFLTLSVPTLSSPHPHPRLIPASPSSNLSHPPSRPLHPRHDDPDCDGPHTYTATYTSDIVRTHTIFSVSTATVTYTSLRTSTGARRPHTRTMTQTEVMTRTVTDGAPAAAITVTKTLTDTDTDVLTQTAVGAPTTVTVSSTPSASPGPGGECNTGSLQCCDTVAPASSPDMSGILSALGIAVDVLNGLGDGLVGTSCSPISALSLGGGVECNQSPVCCNNNTYQGLINIGCVPIHL